MNRTCAVWVAACVVALGMGLASCGSQTNQDASQATVEVSSFPAADIWIDGTWKGSTPASISVPPGSHDVVLRQTGFGEYQEKVDVAAGAHHALEAVLVAQDLDDEQVLAQLGRPFEVEIQPFDAPERHRGGRKAPPAVLLWPQGDIRAVGLSTFAIELSEEYEGDGYLVFRKGKNVLYKEIFDPDTLTTVATIPLDVLQKIDVNDTVTWGIVFDSRRKKAVESTFKVVDRQKADRQLSKMAHDRHLNRQPPVTRALLEAAALENYRLYSEALVKSLEIVQENPTSIAPYQRIVTTLRRLDAEDTRLWDVASQYVSGGGRARSSRSGIAAFAPQTAQPLPVPTGPAVADAGSTAPKTAGPGDAVTPGLRPGGDTGTTPAAPGSTGSAPAAGSPGASAAPGDPRALADAVIHAAEEAKVVAAEQRQLADAAQAEADTAQTNLETATAEADAKRKAAQDAAHAFQEDPTPENEQAREEAERESAEAEQRQAQAERDAERASAEAARTNAKAEKAAAAVERLMGDAANLTQQAEAPAGPVSPESPEPKDGASRGTKERDAGPQPADNLQRILETQRACDQAQAEVERLEGLTQDAPDDASLREELDAARTRLQQADLERQQALEGYAPQPEKDRADRKDREARKAEK